MMANATEPRRDDWMNALRSRQTFTRPTLALLAGLFGTAWIQPVAWSDESDGTDQPALKVVEDRPAGSPVDDASDQQNSAPTGEQTDERAGEQADGAEAPAPPSLTPQADPGQADLDEAVLKRIEAETNSQLKEVAALIESALAKGLSDENKAFAKQMLGSIQLQRGQGLSAAMVRVRGRQQLQLRDEALKALESAVRNDPELVEAHLLIARLNLLPQGDVDAVRRATTAAIKLLADSPEELSEAYSIRALTQESPKKKLADLNAAIAADAENVVALQQRAAVRLQRDEIDEAVADLQRILEIDPTNVQVATEAVQQLVEMDRADDAVKLLSEAIQAKPSEGLYRLRAILYRMLEKDDEAFSDLNKAIAMQPQDPLALLQRAEIALGRDNLKAAKQDLDSALAIAPQVEQLDQTIVVRCFIAVAEGRLADAITDMKTLVQRDPENTDRQRQLANLYLQDERPRKAIETLTNMLAKNEDDPDLLRARGDAYLAVGDHRKAVEDYEAAVRAIGDASPPALPGLLNNLAWVLATSPQEGVRDGQRSLELGRRAVELTEESEAHILSTLAAGYAETGDFENAIKWSEKAVQLGRENNDEQLEQLEKELQSYRNEEPWREKQQTEENQVPLLSSEDLIDT